MEITLMAGCLMVTGCASIMERQTVSNTNIIGQSMWSYARGPYPGVRSYASNFGTREVSQEARKHDLRAVGGVGGAICLSIVVTPFWIADIVLCTGFDTVLLPYDLVKWGTDKNGNPTKSLNATSQSAPSAASEAVQD